MMEHENIINKLHELLGETGKNFNILEEQIDINVQMDYFELSKKMKLQKDENAFSNKDLLYNEDIGLHEKKELLTKIALIEDVEIYRFLEDYQKKAPEEMHDWAILALQENRMLLQSNLLDENQVFISTGLGGKQNMLRYFVVIMGKEIEEFTDTQKKVVTNEIHYGIKQSMGEVETLEFEKNFVKVLCLIPIKSSLKDAFKSIIKECNEIGDFLASDFIVTNVKKLSLNEIKQFIEQSDKNENGKKIDN